MNLNMSKKLICLIVSFLFLGSATYAAQYYRVVCDHSVHGGKYKGLGSKKASMCQKFKKQHNESFHGGKTYAQCSSIAG